MMKRHPIAIRRIDHVVIRVNDLERMVTFYRDVLGCPVERDSSEHGLTQLRAGESLIDLMDRRGPVGAAGGDVPEPGGQNMDHVCVQVEPWDEGSIVRHLNEHGVEAGDIVRRYGALGYGPSLYLHDPEGNTVELKGPADATPADGSSD